MENISLLEKKLNWARDNPVQLKKKIEWAKDFIDFFHLPYCDKDERLEWYYCKGLADSQE